MKISSATQIINACRGNAQRSVAAGAIANYELDQRTDAVDIDISDGGINVEKLKSGTAPWNAQGRLVFVGVRDGIVGYDDPIAKQIADKYNELGPKEFKKYVEERGPEVQKDVREAFFKAQPKVHEQLYREICQVIEEAGIPDTYFNGFNKPLRLEENPDVVLALDSGDIEKIKARYHAYSMEEPIEGQAVDVDILKPNPEEHKVEIIGKEPVFMPHIDSVHGWCGLEGKIEDDPAGGIKKAQSIVTQLMDLRKQYVDRAIEYASQ